MSTGDGEGGPGEGVVHAAMRGDGDALRRLWHENRRWVAAVLLAHKPRSAELDDLLQEVAATVVARIGGLRDAQAFGPWLRAVALNVARTTGRRQGVGDRWLRRERSLGGRGAGGGWGEWGEPRDGGPERSAAAEEGARLMRLAERLPEGYREPLLLRCVRGMSYRQIGQLLDLPETTVETRIARGRRMLRELAEGETRAGALAPLAEAKEPSR